MGVLLSFCSGEDRPTNKELASNVQILTGKVSSLEKEIKTAKEKHKNVEKINRKLLQEIHELERLNSNYGILLHGEVDKTADLIMRTNLHLNYMDDATEKKHIIDVLECVYKIANS